MFLKPGQIRDAVNYFGSFWIIFSVVFIIVNGQEGNGCGHTVMGTESGTLASQNYPGTYPVDSWCKWRLRVPKGRTLRLLFGDFDVERSPGCRNGSLTITSNDGAPSLGPLCGQLEASEKNVTVNSNEVTIVFNSGPHHSGRGFLFSYTTDQHSGLISCRQRGTHFISQQFSVYCPAGCKDVTGDICGHSEQGYRDTSVLCKAAVHAGVVSDNVGGQITVTRGRSLTLYESSFANGILSKMGSLSEKKLVFSKECNEELTVSGFNASSIWREVNKLGQLVLWSPKNMDAEGQLLPWASDGSDREPWLELELTDKGSVTGIITRGSADFYIESYVLLFSKDRRNWKVYKAALSREKKVFEAHSDGHLRVLNSLFPPVVVRYLRLQPQSWQGRASAHVQVLGCPLPKIHPRPRSAGGSPSLKVDVSTTPLPNPVPTEDPVIIKDSSLSSNQPVIVVVGVILGLILCVSCLLAGVWWNRRKKPAHMKKYSLPKVASQSLQGKSLPCSDSELISYPLERGVHDALPNPPLNDYAEPDVVAGGQKLGSTFRPTVEVGYTVPFTFNHYDTPGKLLEHTEPLPLESEYATPFSDQPPDPNLATPQGTLHNNKHVLPMVSTRTRTTITQAQYDCPSHRELPNGYCTTSLHANGPCPASVVYTEPEPLSSNSLLQHTYEEPF
ncbi:discoidin, CUB and LCCL domain-containing protein 1 isoform X1 [Coregonus clupeaformis]|uniref:discoidin, CUB and LCCL domain-containing protein 1 isoform X1 n=1 Tax=Coregonus clupeaformis TaxID=59861 RepID=UPI001BDFCF6A|nr:discoidin, CUB and LCCL domain-containing protein 1 isoform X1 [Coregonus clupeaformis]